jgi:hypothetical protein
MEQAGKSFRIGHGSGDLRAILIMTQDLEKNGWKVHQIKGRKLEKDMVMDLEETLQFEVYDTKDYPNEAHPPLAGRIYNNDFIAFATTLEKYLIKHKQYNNLD